jgi:membrane protein
LNPSESGFSIFIRRISARFNRIKHQFLEYKIVIFVAALGKKMAQDDISNMAASVSYYAFLSLFPLILSLLAIFGQFFSSESITTGLINLISSYLPGSRDILSNNISDIVRLRGALGIVGVLGLLWSGSGVFSALTHAINKAWDNRYEHPFYIRKPREFLMIFVGGVLLILSLASTTFLARLGNLNLPFSGALVNIGTAVVAFIFSLVVIGGVHKFAPVTGISWRHIWPGSLLSTFLFETAKTGFVFYLNNFNQYDKVYGSIESVIILLVWIYFSAFILLLGSEFSSLVYRIKRDGKLTDSDNNHMDLSE